MAFPPERITVKRHRDEDPVDALCKSRPILMIQQTVFFADPSRHRTEKEQT